MSRFFETTTPTIESEGRTMRLFLRATIALTVLNVEGCGFVDGDILTADAPHDGGASLRDGNVIDVNATHGDVIDARADADDASRSQDAGSDASELPDAISPDDTGSTAPVDAALFADAGPVLGTFVTNDVSFVYGITDDGDLIYASADDGTLYAVPLTGGAPVVLANDPTSGGFLGGVSAQVSGKYVVYFTEARDSDAPTLAGVWSRDRDVPLAVAGCTTVDVSSDGSYIVYATNFNASASTEDIVGASLAAPMVRTTLYAGARVGDEMATGRCWPQMQFLGSTSQAMIGTCPADGRLGPFSLATVDAAAAWAMVAYEAVSPSKGRLYQTDALGDRFFVPDSDDNDRVDLFAVGDSTPIHIGPAFDAFLTGDGTRIFALTSNGDAGTTFVNSPTSAFAPTVSVPTTLERFYGATADGAYVLASTTGINEQSTNDVFLVQTSSGTITPLDTSNTDGVPDEYGIGLLDSGDVFTADGSYALWLQNVDSLAVVGYVTESRGTLMASAVAGSHAPTSLAANVSALVAASGTKIVVAANTTGTVSTGGEWVDSPPIFFDVQVIDVASSAPPVTLATQAVEFLLSPAKDRVVFVISQGDAPGLYVAPVP